jgi:hypothetical protein
MLAPEPPHAHRASALANLPADLTCVVWRGLRTAARVLDYSPFADVEGSTAFGPVVIGVARTCLPRKMLRIQLRRGWTAVRRRAESLTIARLWWRAVSAWSVVSWGR